MKRTLTVIAQAIVFLVVFLAGSLWDPFKLKWFVWHPTVTSTRYFVPDGLLVMVVIYLILIAIEAARKRLKDAVLWSTIAMLIALLFGMWAKFGWVTHDLLG